MEILIINTAESVEERFNNITAGFQNSIGAIGDSIKNLAANASLYNLCPERFGDYINDSGIAKSLQDGIGNLMKLDLLNILKTNFKYCFLTALNWKIELIRRLNPD